LLFRPCSTDPADTVHHVSRRRPRSAAADGGPRVDSPALIAARERRAATLAGLVDAGVVGAADGLPIAERWDELADAVREHQVVIVAGETGSGKSTQLPKLCLAARPRRARPDRPHPAASGGRPVDRRTRRRRARRRALGGAVGYSVRFTDRVADHTLVKVMTDGILLAEIQRDRMLRRYDTIIIDEAHERSLNIDFLLGYLKQLLPKRPDLKVIVTSATIDTERFAEHFARPGAPAPVISVEGRTYPVEVRYRPIGDDPDDDRDQVQAVIDAVDELAHEGPGDVLVFLSGEREIHDTADAIRRLDLRHTEVLPLYAGCRRSSSTASSSRTRDAGWCCPPTSPRPRSPCPACATSSTPARRASRATATGSRCSACRSSRCRRRRRTSAPDGAAASPPACASGCTPRTTSAARSSPSPRSCAPTSPRSSCR
jgi:hypothetical protein